MNCTPVKRKSFRDQIIGDELYLFGDDDETLIVLNSVAAKIWSICDGAHTVGEMTGIMAEAFPEIDPAMLSSDIREALAQFQKAGLLAQG